MDDRGSYETFKARAARVVDVGLWLLAGAPVLAFVPLYVAALGSMIRLGHWPTPGQDPYPFQGAVFDVSAMLGGMLIWLWLVGPVGLLPLWRFLHPTQRLWRHATLGAVSLGVATVLLSADPGGLIEWWYD
jgi:hypothetical protein